MCRRAVKKLGPSSRGKQGFFDQLLNGAVAVAVAAAALHAAVNGFLVWKWASLDWY